MKIAVTSRGDSLSSAVDERFGRAAKFLVYDTDTDAYEVIDNTQNLNAAQGAGIQAAEAVSRTGAHVVVTGHCGPKAFRTLQAAAIKVVVGASGTVQDALDQFQSGQLRALDAPDVAGHWT